MSRIFPILVPQVSVNDETVQLVRWSAAHGTHVMPGDPLCELETSKAVAEMPSEHAGVVFHLVSSPAMVRVGDRIGLIGPDLETLRGFVAQSELEAEGSESSGPALRATPRARVLLTRYGLSLEEVAAGIRGTVKESDVQRYLAARQAPEEPGTDVPPVGHYAIPERPLTRHELAVVQALQASQQRTILATVDIDVDLTDIVAAIARQRARGTMVSLQHVVIAALGKVLPHYPKFQSFRWGAELYRYRDIDLAFVVRLPDGRLFTPVVRNVDRLGVREVATACLSQAAKVFRGTVEPHDLEGACLTVSQLSVPGVHRFTVLPGRCQSAALAIGGSRTVSVPQSEGGPREVATFVLSYDHCVCDGVSAAEFLAALRGSLGDVSRD